MIMSESENTTPNREMTFGEKAVGLTFNPSGDKDVQKVKELYAEIIDLLHNLKRNTDAMTEQKDSCFEIAKMEAMGAQMWAVKAITYQF